MDMGAFEIGGLIGIGVIVAWLGFFLLGTRGEVPLENDEEASPW